MGEHAVCIHIPSLREEMKGEGVRKYKKRTGILLSFAFLFIYFDIFFFYLF